MVSIQASYLGVTVWIVTVDSLSEITPLTQPCSRGNFLYSLLLFSCL